MRHEPGALTEEQATRMLAGMNEVIRAGEEMRQLRTEMIKLFAGFGWTQDKIARITEMSQPAVSKQMTRFAADDPLPRMGLALEQPDAAWLQGRLWALAEEVAEALDAARCARFVGALARGRKHFTPESTDELRRLLEADLRLGAAELPATFRAAYDEISRALDTGPKPAAAGSDPDPARAPAPASVSRTVARQLQRDRLRGDS
ncbi:sigma-70 family RNA polymerase sigma factor [Streptomyces erythrochromogenes]|uniref:sigma-70 family RNA polymerase sigma factor n=1 Tax=Streptomyces erythrochromogenes TaxID=285574 RepID=UPI00386C3C30|nr:sigma-70 family RNA polymerase sigma factor [Streptomyces erythrochromogenes]